ncbi:MAG TPA: rhomboid family intramembrane serine protease [Candidatus Acidoferrales bacterium]|nr:rhomboid family intramembrane serine protease [Candidatus Acidoferrales bacterium]
MFNAKEKQRRPGLCPACGTLVGSSATRCHQCGASLTFSLAAVSRSLSKIMPATAPVTYFILSICCVLYGISLLFTIHSGFPTAPEGGSMMGKLFGIGSVAAPVLERLGASLPLAIDIRQPWRFVTACFLHANLLHIVFNMWVLVDLAPTIEELYGSSRFFFLYTVCGIGGYVLSGFFGHFSIGASGAIVGLIGVLLAITYRRGGSHMQLLRTQVYRWIIYLVVWGFFFPGVDNMAHLGGGITGFILGKLMMDRAPATPSERKRAYALGWLAAAVMLASFGFMVLTGGHELFLRR